MKTKKRSYLMIILIICMMIIMLTIPNYSFAYDPIKNPGTYDPSNYGTPEEDVQYITEKIGPIFGTITTIGIIISVITLAVLGIKYMIGGVSEKAEYKKTMMPYLIGVFFLSGTCFILKIVLQLVKTVG